MGHEYVEMKNSHAAIEAYRRAVGKECFVPIAPPLNNRPRCESERLQGMVWFRSGIRIAEYAPLFPLLLSTRHGLKVRKYPFAG